MTTGKTIALTRQTLVGKMMFLFFNMLSRFVTAFLLRSKCLLISVLQSLSTVILEPKKIKSVAVSTFPPSICHEVIGPDAMILVFFECWVLNQLFHSPLSPSRGSLFHYAFCYSFQLLSHIQLFVTQWTAARQTSLSTTNSWSLPKLMSIESVMPSNHSSSVIPFSSCLQSFPTSESFPMSQLFASGGQSITVSASASVLPMNT